MAKFLVTIIWSPFGFHIVDILPPKVKFNSAYFITHILNPLVNKKTEYGFQNGKRKVDLHLDNCKVHNSKVSIDTTEENGFKRLDHSPYSPDLAPSDFFLFGYIKEKLRGSKYTSADALEDGIKYILSQIPKEMLLAVFDEWMKRCEAVIANEGSYIDEL